MWSNARNEFVFEQEVYDAPWYVGADSRTLYIVGPDETEGPDDEIADALDAHCRDHGDAYQDLLDAAAEALGLTRMPDALKRFTPEDGYYGA
jgi:hypothetical protein